MRSIICRDASYNSVVVLNIAEERAHGRGMERI